MVKKQGYLWYRVMMAVAVIATMVMAGCAAPSGNVVSSVENAAPLANSAASVEKGAASSGGAPQEGIKVHGHWTIEVRNPDGALVERREFDNALVTPGTLARFLGRRNSVGGWVVYLWTTTGTGPFMDTQGNNNAALILEASYGLSFPTYFKNLVVDVPSSGANANRLVLSGNATAQRDGVIQRVSTAVNELDAIGPPTGTYLSSWNYFTQADLATPVNVGGGQLIAVTVVLSFS